MMALRKQNSSAEFSTNGLSEWANFLDGIRKFRFRTAKFFGPHSDGGAVGEIDMLQVRFGNRSGRFHNIEGRN
jgi:hypothetical protein